LVVSSSDLVVRGLLMATSLSPQGARKNTLEAMWQTLDSDRSSALRRKRQHAEITVPSLLPLAGKSQHQDLPVPYSGLSAEGINALAARLVSVVLPIGSLPVFELFIDQKFVPEGRNTTEMETVLRRVEEAVMNRLYLTNLRPQLFLVFKHLIAIGDVLMVMLPNLDIRLHRFDEYTVKRTTEGTWREIIIRQMIDPELQEQSIRDIEPSKPAVSSAGTAGFPQSNSSSRQFEPIFDKLCREGEDLPVTFAREFRGVRFDDDKKFEVTAHMPLRWNAISGEDYGTSLVEDAFGDIRSLDGLSAGLIDGVALNSEYRWGVNPAGITEIDDLRQSTNGDWVPAVDGDVFPMNFQHAAQVEATLRAVTFMRQSLGRRFLMNSAAQPTGERVTARQVTIIAQELEQALGGVLSMVNRDIMIPLIKRAVWQLSREESGVFPEEFGEFIKDRDSLIKLRVRTGLELLQREAEQEKIDQLLERIARLPQSAQDVFLWDGLARRIIKNIGIEPVGIVKTPEQIAAEAQARMQEQQALMAQDAAQKAAIAAAKVGGQPNQPSEGVTQ